MSAIPMQQCMKCGQFKPIDELMTKTSYPDPENRQKKHITVECDSCHNEPKRDLSAMPPQRK